MTEVSKMKSHDVLEALASKHDEDLFVPECHDGYGGRRRLDAWVLLRTWSPWTTIGYEIKVTRQDFKKDRKWMDYLRLCHQFSFVCPAGLIQPNELPDGVGLAWVSTSGTVHTRKRAPRNDPDDAAIRDLMTYVLMSRTVIVSDMHEANAKKLPDTRERRAEQYREIVSKAEERKELAEFVVGHVRRQCAEMQAKVKVADHQNAEAERLREYLIEHGVNWETGNYGNDPWRAKHDIGLALGIIDDAQLDQFLERTVRVVSNARTELAQLRASLQSAEKEKAG